ncbi:hypothetical protein HZU40_34130 (plasmid) [Mycolicibacterium fluoranthenivorans]|uniref:Uncharacterized protein n=1 Tax=Mycolicibacterium fluoranthenivorans TaxID=258505 RepID=A0A7G8PQE8_9MYCO|nr:hypothetical protein [Mycolicibacterium fluoranthenivorans]QNJ96564.1 hypothetical protein HZU40_34130 [Mycolicibacterium fluoranthenivorans]
MLTHFANSSGIHRSVNLAPIFGGHVGLVDAVLVKTNAAESRGDYLIDLMQL